MSDPLPAQASHASTLALLERELLFGKVARNLIDDGYSIQPNAMPVALSQALLDHINEMKPSTFHDAGIGRAKGATVNELVRKDEISWIDGTTGSGADWLDWTGALQTYLNEYLFLGLFSFESHFARYRKGDFYAKHLDAFAGGNSRKLSVVIYLNKGWVASDGGELVLYTGKMPAGGIRVIPEFGTLVVFLSEDISHEVLTTTCDRHSIAGWFRTNDGLPRIT